MSSQKKRILVVDDEKDILELLRVILEKERFEVWEANTSREALEQIEKMPDLVLLDIRIPGKLSGLDVCHRLKKDKKYRHIPVIIFSALVSNHDIEQGLKAGADEYIPRPYDPKGLIRLVKKYIK